MRWSHNLTDKEQIKIFVTEMTKFLLMTFLFPSEQESAVTIGCV